MFCRLFKICGRSFAVLFFGQIFVITENGHWESGNNCKDKVTFLKLQVFFLPIIRNPMAGRIWIAEHMMKGQPRLGTSSVLRVRVDPSMTVWSDPFKSVWFDESNFGCCSKPQAPWPFVLGKKGRTNRDTELKIKQRQLTTLPTENNAC